MEKEDSVLFKYLDVRGAYSMLYMGNLQFTNATRLNDPFDCHPDLIDFSNVPENNYRNLDKDFLRKMESNRFIKNWLQVWICSLSKVFDSVQMWAYYGNHKGVCIGLDRDLTAKCVSRCFWSAMEKDGYGKDVHYEDIVHKPDYFHEPMDFFTYQLTTKAKAWQHEQEVRLYVIKPPFTYCRLPYRPKSRFKRIDCKDVRHYPILQKKCFVSIYLGVNISEEYKISLIELVMEKYPDMKIYQMEPDPVSFKLTPILLNGKEILSGLSVRHNIRKYFRDAITRFRTRSRKPKRYWLTGI